MSQLDELDPAYRVILCDLWGVVHNGQHLFPGVTERLGRWKDEGRTIIFVSNAPRPAATIESHLERLGMPRNAYDAVTTSGEAGIVALTSPPRPVGFLGTPEDRADLVSRGIMIIPTDFAELACTGLDEWRSEPGDYLDQLEGWAKTGIVMHCLNPDRVVIHGSRQEACAGALADSYESFGGHVEWYGKPHGPIYDHARGLAGNPPLKEMLAIGDGLLTDMLGAARFGIAAVYVSHGIHAGEPIPDDFASSNGLGDWRPIFSVEGLA